MQKSKILSSEFFTSIKKSAIFLGVFITISLFSLNSFASDSEGDKFNAGDLIFHHIKDDYSWHFWDGATAYFPVMLYTEEGVKIFSSRNFYNEQHEAIPYMGYEIVHGKIHEVEGAGAAIIKFDFSLTKNVATLLIVAFLMLIIFLSVAKTYKKRVGQAPKGLQSFIEPIILFVRDEIAIPNLGKDYMKYMPFLLTMFFFIWIGNLLGLTPGAANLTGNIAVTASLALLTFIITMASSKKYYWGHIFNPPGVPFLIKLILVPVEIIGIFTKPFSLMVRLFANITAGHVVMLSLISLIFIMQSYAVGVVSTAFSLFMMAIELLVAALQAYIFTLLSSIYFAQAKEVAHH